MFKCTEGWRNTTICTKMGIVLGRVARWPRGSPAEMPQIPFLAWYWFLGFEVASRHVLQRTWEEGGPGPGGGGGVGGTESATNTACFPGLFQNLELFT
jgi:hypothetical protein